MRENSPSEIFRNLVAEIANDQAIQRCLQALKLSEELVISENSKWILFQIVPQYQIPKTTVIFQFHRTIIPFGEI